MSRYLTGSEKRKILHNLNGIKIISIKRNEGLDSEMVPYLDKLNAIKGLVTLQSCQGHKYKSRNYPGTQMLETAHVMLKLSKKLSISFYEKVAKLVAIKNVERVSVEFDALGSLQEVVMIYFYGGDHDKDVKPVMDKVCDFFSSLKEPIRESGRNTEPSESRPSVPPNMKMRGRRNG